MRHFSLYNGDRLHVRMMNARNFLSVLLFWILLSAPAANGQQDKAAGVVDREGQSGRGESDTVHVGVGRKSPRAERLHTVVIGSGGDAIPVGVRVGERRSSGRGCPDWCEVNAIGRALDREPQFVVRAGAPRDRDSRIGRVLHHVRDGERVRRTQRCGAELGDSDVVEYGVGRSPVIVRRQGQTATPTGRRPAVKRMVSTTAAGEPGSTGLPRRG